MRFPRKTQRYKLVRGCVRRRAYSCAELDLLLYRFIAQSGTLHRRAWAWAQEGLGAEYPSFRCLIVQSLCANSGRKRAVLRFFQMHRLEVRSAFVGLRVPGLCYYY